MKPALLMISISIFLSSCNSNVETTPIQSSDNSSATQVVTVRDTAKSIFADDGKASFNITSVDSNSGYNFKMIETNYKVAFIALHDSRDLQHYIARYTSETKSCTGCEAQERRIKVELRPFEHPEKTDLTILQDCDELTLDVRTYKTAKYGCCGAEDELAIYDYENKKIIAGDSKIILGEIPNSPITMYISYKPEYQDSSLLGRLYLAYNSLDSYTLTIKSKPLSKDDCSPFSPRITVKSIHAQDKFEEVTNEYTFWSLDNITTTDQIKDLTIKIVYWCDKKLHMDPISIPIIKGKPFGKDDRNQFVEYKH